jgi:hypothetical protein
MRWLLGALGIAAALVMTIVIHRATESRAPKPAHPAPIAVHVPRSARLDADGWAKVQQAVRLRSMALGAKRTALYRSFAANMALQHLMSLRPILPGRCAGAIVYLYDNLRDLLDAYPGESWQPLRRLIAKQPSLLVCAPRPSGPRSVYVG